ncbi:MAG: adenosylmethionine decarboxylase [Candidatus Atribacteria bacterium]|nr:adenosylmethionine decarboxylase [Candidatus Atribacteria bacterium]
MRKFFEVGTHLVLDGYSTNTALLSDMNRVSSFLDEYPNRMEMTKIMPPYVFRYQGGSPQENGLSGIVLIAESHISIHTFPSKGYLSVDVFSCKPFDVDAATDYLVNYFKLSEFTRQVLDRGLEYPRDLDESLSLVVDDRLDSLEKIAHT